MGLVGTVVRREELGTLDVLRAPVWIFDLDHAVKWWANLAAVTGQKLDPPMFLELWERRFALGDHDDSQLYTADLKWSPERME